MIADIPNGRSKEIHLPYQQPTSLGKRYSSTSPGATGSERYYVTPNGMPWAIDIVHDFAPPKEKVPVNLAYNYFSSWAISGGAKYQDWYKDNPGYRNTTNLQRAN
jgi:LruC domain-containing protein